MSFLLDNSHPLLDNPPQLDGCRNSPKGEGAEMMPDVAGTIAEICRYPVKGLSAEELDRVVLTPGECLPHDRRFAIALGSTPFDPEHPEWLPKTHFIMLMRDEKLARLQTRFDVESGVLSIAEGERVLLRAPITDL